MPIARAFATPTKLQEHVSKHGFQYGVSTDADYLAQALAFLNSPPHQHIVECVDSDGDTVRFDVMTEDFGIVTHDGIIRTFFRPIPGILSPIGIDYRLTHGYATNRDYFEANC